MDNQIFEESPAASAAAGDTVRQIEKQARQLAYDTRYYVKKQLSGKPVNANTMQRMLLMRLQKSTAIPAVKERAKEMLIGKVSKKVAAAEQVQIKNLAIDSLANTLNKVFVEGVSKKSDIRLDYLEELFDDEKRKYKVRVTDVNKGTSYVRFATREKITDLRRKGLKVEKTEYGDPREDEAKHGSQTASVLGGGEKSKKDYDGDGKKESPAKEYRGVVHNAIQRKRGGTPDGQDTSSVKEEFLDEINSKETGKKITGKDVDNSSLIKVFPDDSSSTASAGGSNAQQSVGQRQPISAGYEMTGVFVTDGTNSDSLTLFRQYVAEKAESEQQQKLFGLALSVKRGETPRSEVSAEVLKIVDTMSEKKIRDFAKTKHEGLPEKVQKEAKETSCEKDSRELPTERELIKNKLRAALGVKNPIVMTAGYEPECELVSEEESDRTTDRAREGGDWRSRSQRGPVRRRPSVADDPRYGSMSDDEWARSSKNPRNQSRSRRRKY